MKRSILALALAFGATAGWAIEAAPTSPDFAHLFRRVSESAFIVRATLDKYESAMMKLPAPPEAAPNGGPVRYDLGRLRFGSLYTLAVKQVLCQQADWSAGAIQKRTLKGPVHIFIPDDEPSSKPNREFPFRFDLREEFSANIEYLILLREDPIQESVLQAYKLDPKRTYYRAVWGRSGAVAIPTGKEKGNPRDFATPLISAVTAMCEAVSTPDPVARRVQLMQYMQIADPDLRPQIEAAIQALEKPPSRE